MKKYQSRYLDKYLKKELRNKILILTGPRQSGKTMLSRHLLGSEKNHDYFNYFDPSDRLNLEKKEWNRKAKYLVFDEFHIKKDWKRWLKVLYEKEKLSQGIIVTGSARLEAYKRMGDSLAGCFFSFRLHPLDLREICQLYKKQAPDEILDRLLKVSGFPEPYFRGSQSFYNRWQKTHTESILQEDMLELDRYHRISQLQTLLELLKNYVGQSVRYETLSSVLQCDGKTVKKMLDLLESFYFIFKVLPYYKNISKSIRKSPKYYFYDIAQVKNTGARFENLVACALLKNNHFREDCYGENRELFYLRNKDKREVDFLVTKEHVPYQMIEVKWKNDKLSTHFDCFARDMTESVQKIQLIKELHRERSTISGHQICKASSWLSNLK